jgi:hypothetical protein
MRYVVGMDGTLALWFDPLGDAAADAPRIDVHVNLWRDLPSGFDFLDVGLRFKDVAELARVLMFVPGSINRDDVSDLWAVMRYGEVLKIVFNEVVLPGPGSADAYLIEQDGRPWLTIHRIDVARDLSFETVYSPDGDGTIITFEEQFCNRLRAAVNGCDGYARFRIDLQGAASRMFTVETHSQHGHLAPATDVTETTEFRLNVVRSYPEVVAHRARIGRFSIEKVHYFLIRDVGRRLVAQHGGVRNVRRLETRPWRAYVENRPGGAAGEMDRFVIYHWKADGRIQPFEEFAAYASFAADRPHLAWYAVGIVLLGALGSAVASEASALVALASWSSAVTASATLFLCTLPVAVFWWFSKRTSFGAAVARLTKRRRSS